MNVIKPVVYCIMLLILMPGPTSAQSESTSHTIVFDGIGLTFDTTIGDWVMARQQAGTPLEAAQVGFSDAASTTFLIFSDPYPELTGDQFPARISVYRMADIAPYDFLQAEADELATMIDTRPDLTQFYAYGNQLPYLPVVSHGQIIRARGSYIDGERLRGIAYLTTIQASVDPLTSRSLFYTIQAITDDGQFYISANFAINTYLFPPEIPLDFDLVAFEENIDGYLADSIAMLQSAGDSAFSPPLPLLESIVHTMTFGADH